MKKVLSLYAMCLLLACETQINFDGLESNSQPVIYAKLFSDATVEVTVLASAPAKGVFENDRFIDDAIIKLITDKADTFDIPFVADGFYSDQLNFCLDDTFQLTFLSEIGRSVSDKLKIPATPSYTDVRILPYTVQNFSYTNRLSLDIPFDESEIFAINVIGFNEENSTAFEVFPIEIGDGADITACSGFNGTSDLIYEADFSCYPNGLLPMNIAFSIPEEYINKNNQLSVILKSASDSFLEFESAFYDYQAIDLFFEEPLPPYSNFDMGFGYFGTFNQIKFSLDIP